MFPSTYIPTVLTDLAPLYTLGTVNPNLAPLYTLGTVLKGQVWFWKEIGFGCIFQEIASRNDFLPRGATLIPFDPRSSILGQRRAF